MGGDCGAKEAGVNDAQCDADGIGRSRYAAVRSEPRRWEGSLDLDAVTLAMLSGQFDGVLRRPFWSAAAWSASRA